jgi:hypothetical protein
MNKKIVLGISVLLIILVGAFLILKWGSSDKNEALFNEKMSRSFLLKMRNHQLADEISKYVNKFQSDYYYLSEEVDKDTCKVTLTVAYKLRYYKYEGIVGYLNMDGKTIFVLTNQSIFYSNPEFLRWSKFNDLQKSFVNQLDTNRIVQFRYHTYHNRDIRPVTSFYLINGIKHVKDIKFIPPVITPDKVH